MSFDISGSALYLTIASSVANLRNALSALKQLGFTGGSIEVFSREGFDSEEGEVFSSYLPLLGVSRGKYWIESIVDGSPDRVVPLSATIMLKVTV